MDVRAPDTDVNNRVLRFRDSAGKVGLISSVSGTIQLGGTLTDFVNSSSNDPAISLNANGSASFAGIVDAGAGWDAGASNTGGNRLVEGSIYSQVPTTVGNNSAVYTVVKGTDEIIQFLSNGSASFAGIATYGPLSFDGSQHYLSIGAGDLTVGSKTDYSLVYYNSANTVKYGFKTDGSAEFAGNVDAASYTVNGSPLTSFDFPTGTVMLFYQASAPTGFTQNHYSKQQGFTCCKWYWWWYWWFC
jgi:hypothetical protein